MKKIVVILPLLLGGCQTVTRWADDVGQHMPVIGERCEHWECMSESGQARNRMQQQMQDSPPERDVETDTNTNMYTAPPADSYPY